MKASTYFLPIWRCNLYFLVTCMCVKGVFSHSHATNKHKSHVKL
jgi:hypothetical protein